MVRLFLAFAMGFILQTSAKAHDYKQGEVEIGHPWARPTPDGAKNGAAYLTLKNDGKEADKLLSVQTPAAERAEVHEHIHEGDVMKMRAVAGGVALPAGESVAFKPGGYHIMLMGLKQKLEDGKTVPLKLTFAKAGEIDVEAMVQKNPPADKVAGSMDHMDHMDHNHMQ